MTIDQFKNDLLLLSVNARDLLSALSALGDSVSVSETAVGGRMIYLSNPVEPVPQSLLSRVPTIRYNLDKCDQDTKASDVPTLYSEVLTIFVFQDVTNVSESDAESVMNIIKGIVPDVAKVAEIMVQKKDAFAQLPSAFSIEGLFVVPSIVGGTLVRLICAQIEGVHARVAAIANAVILLTPVGIACVMKTWRLILRVQSAQIAEAKSIKAQLDVYFQQAITAYSS